jgi:thymidine kinase
MKKIPNGQMTVYCGPMFAKKTTALIAEVQVIQDNFDDPKISVFKPSIDNRYDLTDIKTHDGHSLQKLTGLTVRPVPLDFDFSQVESNFIIIDEIQFFKESSFESIMKVLAKECDVVVAGLDLDSNGEPFGIMPKILCYSNYIEKLNSICSCCNEEATRTFRKVKAKETVLVGGTDLYEPRCLKHWSEGMEELQNS